MTPTLKIEFPGLYKSASKLSASAQNKFFLLLAANLILLLVVSVLSFVSSAYTQASIAQSVCLVLALAATIALAFLKPQQQWYAARALAESVKTITWRFSMRAEPYYVGDVEAERRFLTNLKGMLHDNEFLKNDVAQNDGDQITPSMRDARSQTWLSRKEIYLNKRIDNQLEWYATKSKFNKGRATKWLALIVILYILAICFAIWRIQAPQQPFNYIELLVTCASCSMAWLQANKFAELQASYGFTTHDVSLVKAASNIIKNEKQFVQFVGDAENAFSREHTQWRARRDVQ
jgi:hypothetical protein